jgi:hypothetical protein
MPFAASHESLLGTTRTLSAVQSTSAFGLTSDIDAGMSTHPRFAKVSTLFRGRLDQGRFETSDSDAAHP